MSRSNLNTFSPQHASAATQQSVLPTFEKGSSVIVVGAGAFGSWTSLYLLREGFKVTLIDAWGPAHSRSSSGDETRVIRSTYGANELYFDLNVQALALWKENQRSFGQQLFHNTGVLWFCYEETTPLVDDSLPFAQKHRMEYQYLSPLELRKRFPLIYVDDLHHAYFDPYGGYLQARQSVQAVSTCFIKEGGDYIQSFVKPKAISSDKLCGVSLSNGNHLEADAYIFACGSWLGKVFPDVLGDVITCSKQEVYYFGVPSHESLAYDQLPVWVDVDGKDFYYGIPGNSNRGFKLGVDIRGEKFDPTSGDHILDPETLDKARRFITHRFPSLKHAPLIENRVCPYENSPDGNFIFDLLPATSNAFVLGGGSGHGFKHGPALGQMVAKILSGDQKVPTLFLLKNRIE
ncbi:FAD-dependent oxidoreductase [Chryseolinea sp. H1M3-3]|uniref:NAD(P)/FAD-dependent oxidoreductase n=1 Tax=Chryseolinea sp. H1M3-3 TaxID=3034144 RepID=UPI0023EC46F4|nr:FAD-dependent oxidoreductase [Chryseolinea sp. H1M3-3]